MTLTSLSDKELVVVCRTAFREFLNLAFEVRRRGIGVWMKKRNDFIFIHPGDEIELRVEKTTVNKY